MFICVAISTWKNTDWNEPKMLTRRDEFSETIYLILSGCPAIAKPECIKDVIMQYHTWTRRFLRHSINLHRIISIIANQNLPIYPIFGQVTAYRITRFALIKAREPSIAINVNINSTCKQINVKMHISTLDKKVSLQAVEKVSKYKMRTFAIPVAKCNRSYKYRSGTKQRRDIGLDELRSQCWAIRKALLNNLYDPDCFKVYGIGFNVLREYQWSKNVLCHKY